METGHLPLSITPARVTTACAICAIGAAEMVKQSGKHPGQLKDEVCSPGGSTIEGVLALEAGSMRGVVADAVISAYEKTKKLGK